MGDVDYEASSSEDQSDIVVTQYDKVGAKSKNAPHDTAKKVASPIAQGKSAMKARRVTI